MLQILLISSALCALVGVAIEMITHDKPLRLLQYFTIQSNLIAGSLALGYWCLHFGTWNNPAAPPLILGLLQSSVLWMTLTGVIFHALISKLYKPSGFKWISNHLTHTAAPLLFFILLFALREPMTASLLWVSYPLIYTLFWLVYGFYKDYYPYWFLRPNGAYPDGFGSYPRVFAFIGALSVSFIVLGLVLGLALDWAMNY